jgi:hypothetical protein
LFVLNLHPVAKNLPNAPAILEQEVEELGPKLAFSGYDLYTTRFGETLNDDIETYLFGKIDKAGADAVRAWIAGDPARMHYKFEDFFLYMDAQKLRTPKGLDWILKHFQGLPQLELMKQMQALRQMHCTMWAEGVREIVSATKSSVKFLVSDHPVTIYHPMLAPDVTECHYPEDPGIDLIGSQTIFALDANHCLILTNLENVRNQDQATLLSRRTNARFRGSSMARTDTLIRGRQLDEASVHAVNFVLKARAKKFVAAADPAWLYPEKYCRLAWQDIAKVLLPRKDLWQFGGEMYFQYTDGTSGYRDQFGRTSTAHEYLTKSTTANLGPNDRCGCGSGIAFRDCCTDIPLQKRPSWSMLSIRERNLALVRAIHDILDLRQGTTWDDVRRSLSNTQVSRIHGAFAALWPRDTQLVELLPRPQQRRSRAVFLGVMDVRTLSTQVTGMLAYIDEIVVPHPFVNGNGVRPEYSPVLQPQIFREQTLREVYTLLILEPWIAAGRVHLVPDPLDYDTGFQQEILTISKDFDKGFKLGPIDEVRAQALIKDDYQRAVKRLPIASLKAYIKRQMAGAGTPMADAEIDLIANHQKAELANDPLSLMDPPNSTGKGGEMRVVKSFAREAGLFLATLTGSMVYTDSDTQWARLHEPDGVHQYDQNPAAQQAVRGLSGIYIHVPIDTYEFQVATANSAKIRAILRTAAAAIQKGLSFDIDAALLAAAPPAERSITYRLHASVPLNGFQRIDVTRLILTFGRSDDTASVSLALFLEPTS